MQSTFTADHVWALAVIADRINEGYIKDNLGEWQNDQWVQTTTANKIMVKNWLRGEPVVVTQQDIEQGQELRNAFKGLLFKQLSGKITDFEAQALSLAQKDEFSNRDMLAFAIISCLPAAHRRDRAQRNIDQDIRSSTSLGGVPGDRVQGEIQIVNSRYSATYNKTRVTARLGDSFVEFWTNSNMTVGSVIRIKAKIKRVRDDKITQLNYVKVCG